MDGERLQPTRNNPCLLNVVREYWRRSTAPSQRKPKHNHIADKLDPFDVAALEKSVNDSAVRVSTIWVSYLIFGLYLVIAAGNVTHRQLFLEEPIKLPVLNIDLPLVGFFFLAPILFVVFHVYVLVQVLLLARTAAYNEAIGHTIKVAADRAPTSSRAC